MKKLLFTWGSEDLSKVFKVTLWVGGRTGIWIQLSLTSELESLTLHNAASSSQRPTAPKPQGLLGRHLVSRSLGQCLVQSSEHAILPWKTSMASYWTLRKISDLKCGFIRTWTTRPLLCPLHVCAGPSPPPHPYHTAAPSTTPSSFQPFAHSYHLLGLLFSIFFLSSFISLFKCYFFREGFFSPISKFPSFSVSSLCFFYSVFQDL